MSVYSECSLWLMLCVYLLVSVQLICIEIFVTRIFVVSSGHKNCWWTELSVWRVRFVVDKQQRHIQWPVWFSYLLVCRTQYDLIIAVLCLHWCLVLQNYVRHEGSDRLAESRHMICATVYQLLMSGHASMSAFVRNKMAKLIVCVARRDWPHRYADFFTNVYAVWLLTFCHFIRTFIFFY